jgi:hypothetical protein
MPEGKGPQSQEPGLAEGDLAGVADEQVLPLDPDGKDKDQGQDVNPGLFAVPGQEDQSDRQQAYPESGPGFADQP